MLNILRKNYNVFNFKAENDYLVLSLLVLKPNPD